MFGSILDVSTPALPFIGIRCPTVAFDQHVPPMLTRRRFLFFLLRECVAPDLMEIILAGGFSHS